MLTEIRDRSSGWFAWVIAALIIIPMAFWGVNEYAATEAVPTLLEIGDQTITENQYQAQLVNEQQRQRQALGAQINESVLNSNFFKQNVLDQLVNRALIDQVAQDQNYQISNEQLVEFIKQSPIFQVDGRFDPSAYERYVVSSQFSKTQFENSIRSDNRLGQVMSGYQESALVLPDDVRYLLEAQAQQRTFDLVTVKYQDYVDSIEVSDAEVETYYNDNIDNYLEPEKISLNYVELDINQVIGEIDLNEDELLAIYDQNVDSYISSETRETRHILLSVDDDNDDEQSAKADSLVAELRAGADFAELAAANSEDPGSANNGGDLGEVERGMMVEEFETATFDLEEGVISDPVKSQFGYHIIEVTKINASAQQSFEDVRFDIEQLERERLAEDELLTRVDQLRDLAFEQPDDLQLISEELGLAIQTTELFDRNTGTGIAASASVRNEAFSDLVFVENINSEPIEVSSGSYVVISKKDYQESRPTDLTLVTEQIRQIVTDQNASKAAGEKGQTLLALAETSWEELAASLEDDENIALETHTVSLADQERVIDANVLSEVANLNLSSDEPILTSIETVDGNFHIVRLTEIAAGDLDTVSEQIKDGTRRLIEQRFGQSLANAYLETLRTELVPEIDPSLL